jgi:hypothetical protein
MAPHPVPLPACGERELSRDAVPVTHKAELNWRRREKKKIDRNRFSLSPFAGRGPGLKATQKLKLNS